jgi:adenine-specific DNA-methyltransferase
MAAPNCYKIEPLDKFNTMDKLKLHSSNLTEANIEKIAALFPNCVVEAKDDNGQLNRKIDFDQLRQELSDSIVEGPQERYRLDWPGKREALLTANAPIAKTLRPCREESVDFDTTQNLFIEGDNLEALKLLQENYLGKVDIIYIDPPYNTGREFIYDDDFSQDSKTYFEQSKQTAEDQSRLVANTEANGRFHSDWLSMMYARLRLACSLLKEEGVIFISIDDHEVSNLRKICDEIFGEGCFIANVVWQKAYVANMTARHISNTHDHILVYAREPEKLKFGRFDRSEEQLKKFKNPDGDPRGPWKAENLSAGKYYSAGQFEITGPTGKSFSPPEGRYWRCNEETFNKWLEEKRITFGLNGEGRPMLKKYLSEVQEGLTPETWWRHEEFGSNKSASTALKQLFDGKQFFDTPKPLELIEQIIKLANFSDGIVLDFFCGSATTAHATLNLNAADGGKRKSIMIQLPEICGEKSEAYKAGYKTIADISKERIRRAGEKIKEENATTAASLDLGFRVLKVDTSNAKDIYYTPDAISQEELALQVDHIKEDRTAEDLLFQVMLDWGVDLALPISKESIQGKNVYFVDENAIAACFDTQINEAFVKELAKHQPLRVVFRDTCFESDSAKINVAEIFKLLSPNTDIKTI